MGKHRDRGSNGGRDGSMLRYLAETLSIDLAVRFIDERCVVECAKSFQ